MTDAKSIQDLVNESYQTKIDQLNAHNLVLSNLLKREREEGARLSRLNTLLTDALRGVNE